MKKQKNKPSPLSLFQAASRPLVNCPNISALTIKRLLPFLLIVTLLEFIKPHVSLCKQFNPERNKLIVLFSFYNTEPKSEGYRFVVLTVNKFLEVEESRAGSLEAAHEETNLADFPADILEL